MLDRDCGGGGLNSAGGPGVHSRGSSSSNSAAGTMKIVRHLV